MKAKTLTYLVAGLIITAVGCKKEEPALAEQTVVKRDRYPIAKEVVAKQRIIDVLSQEEGWELATWNPYETSYVGKVFTDYLRYRISIEEIKDYQKAVECILESDSKLHCEIVAYESHSRAILRLVRQISLHKDKSDSFPSIYILDGDTHSVGRIGKQIKTANPTVDVSGLKTKDGCWFILFGEKAKKVNDFTRQ